MTYFNGEWFRHRAKELGLSGTYMADVLGGSHHKLWTDFCQGKRRLVVAEVEPLARALHVSPFEILYRAGMWSGEPPSLQEAPVLGKVQAGSFTPMADPLPQAQGRIIVESTRPTIFALRVEDTSMDRVAPEGSYVIVDYSKTDIADGQLGVFRQSNEATFKRYREYGGERWLEPDSTDPRHRPIAAGEDQPIELIGRVVEIRPEVRGSDMAEPAPVPRRRASAADQWI